MADFNDAYGDNIGGFTIIGGQKVSFYVDLACILCSVCSDFAPENFRVSGDGTHDICYKQPQSREELLQCYGAMENCPVDAIGDDGHREGADRSETIRQKTLAWLNGESGLNRADFVYSMRGYGHTEKDADKAIRDHLQSRRRLFMDAADKNKTLSEDGQVHTYLSNSASYRQLDRQQQQITTRDMLSFFHGKIQFEQLMALKFPHLFPSKSNRKQP